MPPTQTKKRMGAIPCGCNSTSTKWTKGSLGIAPTPNCSHFLKIVFVVAWGGFYSYFIHQGNKSYKKGKIVRKKLNFMHTKISNIYFKSWVQFRVGAIPRLPGRRIHNGFHLGFSKQHNGLLFYSNRRLHSQRSHKIGLIAVVAFPPSIYLSL